MHLQFWFLPRLRNRFGEDSTSAFDDDRLVVVNRGQDALQQFRGHPQNVVHRARVLRRADDDLVFVHATRNEVAAWNNIAAAEKFSHGDSPRSNAGPEGGLNERCYAHARENPPLFFTTAGGAPSIATTSLPD